MFFLCVSVLFSNQHVFIWDSIYSGLSLWNKSGKIMRFQMQDSSQDGFISKRDNETALWIMAKWAISWMKSRSNYEIIHLIECSRGNEGKDRLDSLRPSWFSPNHSLFFLFWSVFPVWIVVILDAWRSTVSLLFVLATKVRTFSVRLYPPFKRSLLTWCCSSFSMYPETWTSTQLESDSDCSCSAWLLCEQLRHPVHWTRSANNDENSS